MKNLNEVPNEESEEFKEAYLEEKKNLPGTGTFRSIFLNFPQQISQFGGAYSSIFGIFQFPHEYQVFKYFS